MPKIVTTIEPTDEEIRKGKEFLEELLDNVYSAGAYEREMFEFSDYPTFDAVFEAFCKALGLEV